MSRSAAAASSAASSSASRRSRHAGAAAARVQASELSELVVSDTIYPGEPDDPKLPANTLDRAVMVHMYHEVENPYALLWNLAGSLKPGALVGVIDLDRGVSSHGMPPALLKCEFEAVGYRQVRSAPMAGGVGYLAIFEAPVARPKPGDIKACKAR